MSSGTPVQGDLFAECDADAPEPRTSGRSSRKRTARAAHPQPPQPTAGAADAAPEPKRGRPAAIAGTTQRRKPARSAAEGAAAGGEPADAAVSTSMSMATRLLAAGTFDGLRPSDAAPVHYALHVGDTELDASALIGETLRIEWTGRIVCSACGNDTPKSYAQGYCYSCFATLARTDRCMTSPELCHYAQGTCREPEFGERVCMAPHVVYLANSSGLKVGITRERNVPSRWLDQGAAQAVPLLRVATRRDAGLWEAAIREHVGDRTNWRAMLRGVPEPRDLQVEGAALLDTVDGARLPPATRLLENEAVRTFDYPAPAREGTVRSHALEKQGDLRGRLAGIKAQYLLFDDVVFSVRRHGGFDVRLSLTGP